VFRLLGLHGGPHITPPAAASLVDLDDGTTRRALAELTRAHLLEELPHHRYTFHDLLRAYTADRVRTRESEESRRGALGRVLLHYLHTAFAADRMLYPHRVPIEPVAAGPGVSVPPIDGAEDAMAWFTAEHRVLLWAVRAAADAEMDLVAWQLAWCLTTFFDLQGHWHDWAGTQQTALSAASRLGDRSHQAFAHRNLGLALAQLGRDDDSDRHLETALAAYSELAEYAGQAHTHNTLARVRSNQGRIRDALNHALRASQLFQACGLLSGQSRTLNNVGWYHAQLGEYDQALIRCREALALHDEIDDRYGAANTWDSIGLAHHHLRDFDAAVASYRSALRLWREVGDRYNEADTLTRLADTYGAIDDRAAARTALRDALTILEDLDHPDAVEVRAALGGSPPR
jgi:tetratricopeptide (TPR) repeat protein